MVSLQSDVDTGSYLPWFTNMSYKGTYWRNIIKM